jgi:hypothetical protein
LAFSDQRLQVRLESCPVLGGVLEQHLDQPPFAGAKVAMDASAGQAVQNRDRLLRKKFFEFVGGHAFLVKREV